MSGLCVCGVCVCGAPVKEQLAWRAVSTGQVTTWDRRHQLQYMHLWTHMSRRHTHSWQIDAFLTCLTLLINPTLCGCVFVCARRLILKESGLARYLHSAVLLSGTMLVFGGNTHNDTSLSNGAKCFSADFLAYDIGKNKSHINRHFHMGGC